MLYQLPPILCGNIPGCGLGAENVIFNAGIPLIAQIFLNSAAVLSMIFVMVGGAMLLIGLGEEDSVRKARLTVQWALIGLLVALTAHRIVNAVISEVYVGFGGDPLFNFFHTVVRIFTTVLNTGFLLTIMGGGFRIVMARGKDDEVQKGRRMVLYSIVGVVIINVAPFVAKQIVLLI